MESGSQELTRQATAYLTSLAFGVTFLVGTFAGVDGMTTLVRSVIAGAVALVAGHLLAPPAVDAVLTALARDEAKRRAEHKEEEP